jgi:hypothetical protein
MTQCNLEIKIKIEPRIARIFKDSGERKTSKPFGRQKVQFLTFKMVKEIKIKTWNLG